MEVPVDAGAARELAPDLLLRPSPQELAAGPKGSTAHLTIRSIREAIGDPGVVMRDRSGRPFLPWIAFVARMLEAEGGRREL